MQKATTQQSKDLSKAMEKPNSVPRPTEVHLHRFAKKKENARTIVSLGTIQIVAPPEHQERPNQSSTTCQVEEISEASPSKQSPTMQLQQKSPTAVENADETGNSISDDDLFGNTRYSQAEMDSTAQATTVGEKSIEATHDMDSEQKQKSDDQERLETNDSPNAPDLSHTPNEEQEVSGDELLSDKYISDQLMLFLEGGDGENVGLLPGTPRAESNTTAAVHNEAKPEGETSKWWNHRDVEIYSGRPKGMFFGAEWPEGWTMKSYKRQGGKTAGRLDHYWFTPEKKLRLRSIYEIERFILALDAYDGNEEEAKKNMNSFGRPLRRSKNSSSSQKEKPTVEGTKKASKQQPPAKRQRINPQQTSPAGPSKNVFGSVVSIDFLWHLHNSACNDPTKFCDFLITSLPSMYNVKDLTLIIPSQHDVGIGRSRSMSLSTMLGLSQAQFQKLVHTYAYCCGERRALLYLEICRWHLMDLTVLCQHEMTVFSHAFHMERSPLTIARAFEFEQLISFFRENEGEDWFVRQDTETPTQTTAFIRDKLTAYLRSKLDESRPQHSIEAPQNSNSSGRQQQTMQHDVHVQTTGKSLQTASGGASQHHQSGREALSTEAPHSDFTSLAPPITADIDNQQERNEQAKTKEEIIQDSSPVEAPPAIFDGDSQLQ
jgi:hypothetical protein